MKTKYFCLTLLLAASGLPVFGQFNGYQYSVPKHDAPANVSPMATSQPLLGRWQQDFDAWAVEICGHQGGIDRDVAAKIVCNGQTVTIYFRQEVVSFPVDRSEDLSGRNTALLISGGATLLIGFQAGQVYGWQFERPGDRIYYSNRLKPSQSK